MVGIWMDFITIYVVPFGALLGAISIYYVWGWKDVKSELELSRTRPLLHGFGMLAKYVYVPLAAVVFVLGIVYGGIG